LTLKIRRHQPLQLAEALDLSFKLLAQLSLELLFLLQVLLQLPLQFCLLLQLLLKSQLLLLQALSELSSRIRSL